MPLGLCLRRVEQPHKIPAKARLPGTTTVLVVVVIVVVVVVVVVVIEEVVVVVVVVIVVVVVVILILILIIILVQGLGYSSNNTRNISRSKNRDNRRTTSSSKLQ